MERTRAGLGGDDEFWTLVLLLPLLPVLVVAVVVVVGIVLLARSQSVAAMSKPVGGAEVRPIFLRSLLLLRRWMSGRYSK